MEFFFCNREAKINTFLFRLIDSFTIHRPIFVFVELNTTCKPRVPLKPN